jgi:hypothetical protein
MKRYTLTITHMICQSIEDVSLLGRSIVFDFDVRKQALNAYQVALIARGETLFNSDRKWNRSIAAMATRLTGVTIELRDTREAN